MNLTTDQQILAIPAGFLTLAGAPAKVDGVPVWELSDATVGTLNPTADGLFCDFVTGAATPAGTPVRIKVTGDADLGAGVIPVSNVSEDITIILGTRNQAVSGALSLPAPTDKP